MGTSTPKCTWAAERPRGTRQARLAALAGTGGGRCRAAEVKVDCGGGRHGAAEGRGSCNGGPRRRRSHGRRGCSGPRWHQWGTTMASTWVRRSPRCAGPAVRGASAVSRAKEPAAGRVRERRRARRRRSGLRGEGSGWSAARGAAARGRVRGWCEARRGREGHGAAVVSR